MTTQPKQRPSTDDRAWYERLARLTARLVQTDARHAAYWRDMQAKAERLAKGEGR